MKTTSAKFLRTLASELEYALEVFRECCSCGLCEPCKRHPRMQTLIKQARQEADAKSERRKR